MTKTAVTIRRAKPEDHVICGQICFDAFAAINSAHSFPPDIPAVEHAMSLLRMMFSHPGFYCVVAESDGLIVGSNCLDERGDLGGWADYG